MKIIKFILFWLGIINLVSALIGYLIHEPGSMSFLNSRITGLFGITQLITWGFLNMAEQLNDPEKK